MPVSILPAASKSDIGPTAATSKGSSGTSDTSFGGWMAQYAAGFAAQLDSEGGAVSASVSAATYTTTSVTTSSTSLTTSSASTTVLADSSTNTSVTASQAASSVKLILPTSVLPTSLRSTVTPSIAGVIPPQAASEDSNLTQTAEAAQADSAGDDGSQEVEALGLENASSSQNQAAASSTVAVATTALSAAIPSEEHAKTSATDPAHVSGKVLSSVSGSVAGTLAAKAGSVHGAVTKKASVAEDTTSSAIGQSVDLSASIQAVQLANVNAPATSLGNETAAGSKQLASVASHRDGRVSGGASSVASSTTSMAMQYAAVEGGGQDAGTSSSTHGAASAAKTTSSGSTIEKQVSEEAARTSGLGGASLSATASSFTDTSSTASMSTAAGPVLSQQASGVSNVETVAANPYQKLDQTGDSSTPVLLHSNANRVSVGIHDPSLGWVEVKTQSVAGQVSASLLASTSQTHQSLSDQLPSLTQFLSDRSVTVGSVTVQQSTSDGGSSSGGGQPQQQNANQSGEERQATAEVAVGLIETIDFAEETHPLSYISVRA